MIKQKVKTLVTGIGTLEEAEEIRKDMREHYTGAITIVGPDKTHKDYRVRNVTTAPKGTLPSLRLLLPRERRVTVGTYESKESFPDPFKRAIKLRDGRCVGNGRYWEDCDGTYPLEFCQVDHIDPDGDHSMENGQTLCQNCHGVKTARERQERRETAVVWS